MIVVDTSVFVDELFKFDQNRHDKARILFRLIEEKDVLIVEPEIFLAVCFTIFSDVAGKHFDMCNRTW